MPTRIFKKSRKEGWAYQRLGDFIPESSKTRARTALWANYFTQDLEDVYSSVRNAAPPRRLEFASKRLEWTYVRDAHARLGNLDDAFLTCWSIDEDELLAFPRGASGKKWKEVYPFPGEGGQGKVFLYPEIHERDSNRLKSPKEKFWPKSKLSNCWSAEETAEWDETIIPVNNKDIG
jgi:hypothetical protein